MMRAATGGLKESAFRINGVVVGRAPKTLLALYQRKGFKVARTGSPSPLATMGGRQGGA